MTQKQISSIPLTQLQNDQNIIKLTFKCTNEMKAALMTLLNIRKLLSAFIVIINRICIATL